MSTKYQTLAQWLETYQSSYVERLPDGAVLVYVGDGWKNGRSAERELENLLDYEMTGEGNGDFDCILREIPNRPGLDSDYND